MYCKHCGAEHTAAQRYCAVCGKELQEKKKKPITTIVLSCSTGLLAVATIALCLFLPRQYQAGYEAGEERGYEAGYNEGIEKFDEGYALGWEQKQAVIDADIAHTSEYKTWAKSHSELGKANVDDEVKDIYNGLHVAIDNWHDSWQEDAYSRIALVDEAYHGSLVNYMKYCLIEKSLSHSIEAMHNFVDNLMIFENDHIDAEGVFYSDYKEIELALGKKGILS